MLNMPSVVNANLTPRTNYAANTAVVVDNDLASAKDLPALLADCGLEVVVWKHSLKSLQADSESFSYIVINTHRCGDQYGYATQALALKAPVIYFDPQPTDPIEDDAEQPYYWLQPSPSVIDVRVAMEVSRYKFKSRKTIFSQLNMLDKAFSCVGDYLICLDFQGDITHVNAKACELFSVDENQIKGKPWYTLIRTRQDLSARHTQQFISAAINTRAVTKIQPIALQISKKESVLVDGIIGPTNESGNKTGVVCILRQLTSLGALPDLVSSKDSTTGIDIHRIEATGTLLFSPDQLNTINLRHGRLVGDRVLVEIGEQLKSVLRPTDLATHYGGANFLVLFSESTKAQIDNLVQILKKKLVSHGFNDGQLNLTFSFGLATNNELVNYSPVELFYYANYSLAQAQDLGGNQIRIWKQENALQQIGNFDRISGNFSETGSTDYQKMLMLWSILNNPQKITSEIEFLKFLLSHLNSGLNLKKSAFFALKNTQLNYKIGLDASRRSLDEDEVVLSDNQREYVYEVQQEKCDKTSFTSILGESTEVCVVIKGPLAPMGVLWLSFGPDQTFSLKNQRMLNNIAEFAAVKLEQLASSLTQPKSPTHTKTEQDNINFWYTSSEMAEQAEFIEKVAPTDATVLITGESGTGKELLAKSIHARSQRKDKPFVIFDCGAVVESLIESELFGHKRGAFTGANKDSVGCIQRAHTGTLFLDEVGELPIETQVKLLRFTQEKQFAQVGSNTYKKVDVRLVAATNVDLMERIKKGLFREDLYYRLNVFNLKSLPLRERKDDILFLAERYLNVFATEYSKSIADFSENAKCALYQYEWPGNVRELRNLIHKAVILCQSRLLDCTDLGLYPLETAGINQEASLNLPAQPAKSTPITHFSVGNISATSEACDDFTKTMHHDMDKAASSSPHLPVDLFNTPPPSAQSQTSIDPQYQSSHSEVANTDQWQKLVSLSRSEGYQIAPWLEYSLMKSCLQQHNQIVLRAATALGIAESSFRRKWQKLIDTSPPPGEQINAASEHAVNLLLETPQITNKVETMQGLLTKACERLQLSAAEGAKILAVSPPTYRKLKRIIEE